ncbi:exodeoxyribonuclease V subunit gamma [uncultured Pseudacidovorax sp.]|uniref:exodeoxyribonuclease V subunit gamma n=1 Tax=uncultured Pseudacidovorax sp. TaxID=679313 RepID=UPI0025CE92D1|nr:exodeoxyribonuclease V subunit gamma [uncultured Pseudacidovorax sp.]
MPPLQPGLMVLHGNRPEDLRQLLVAWLARHPLAPLEDEVVLVQSNGIAQWLKLALAADPARGGLGITAAFDVQLPAQFLWRAYRAVLGADTVPERSPLDEAPLAWRLMRLLPALTARAAEADPRFAPLARFLAHDPESRKCHQLALRLADLFDQYQVYRADWLQDWAAGLDQLQTLRGGTRPLPEDQQWQARLWRALLDDLGTGAQADAAQGLAGSRAGVHQRFIDALAAHEGPPPSGLPRRVIVFGISALPAQTLQALAALARHAQVMLFVHNPCRHHWTDIVADQDLLRGAYRRQARRPGMPAVLDEAALHQHAHPLLAAWGKQGRDYLHLIDGFDEPDRYRGAWSGIGSGRIDLFSDDTPPGHSLLRQLQDDILELRPLAETRARWPAVDPARDTSLRFHTAHSPQREVEVLHDQLLARFDADPTLQPRDVIVMLPDVDAYAPHIEAVFGRLTRSDPRHIPFTVADQGQRGREPLLVALEALLALPDSRFAASDVLDLLEVQAVRERFGLTEDALPVLKRWIEGAGVRWGLDADQRAQQGLGAAGEANSWRFGLQRMLLGYAAGDGEAFDGIAPFDEVGGLDAAALGPLAALLRAMEDTLKALAEDDTPTAWAERLRALLQRFFAPATPREQVRVQELLQGLDRWLDDCAAAGFDEKLPLSVVRETWLGQLGGGGLAQRFLSGGVSFCTLMPMRAIPFRVVCLLGMNDGDFPRPVMRADFDLMRDDWRPGDRSRRDDDRYLLLEALLSAREQLYLSWVGRDVRDHSARAPSVLVGQLRDHLAAGWRLQGREDDRDALLAALTTEHPLQPFSPRYFAPDAPRAPAVDGLYTYGREWQAAQSAQAPDRDDGALPPWQPEEPIALRPLEDFLAQPIEAFFAQRLHVRFGPGADGSEDALDDELFALGGLENWALEQQLRQALQPWCDEQPGPAAARAALGSTLTQQIDRLASEGRLPLQAFGMLAGQGLRQRVARTFDHYLKACEAWPEVEAEPVLLHWRHAASGVAIEDALPPRRLPAGMSSRGGRSGSRGSGDATGDVDAGPDAARVDADAGAGAIEPARLVLAQGRLHKGKGLSWHHVVRHWPAHLALNWAAGPTRTVLVSESGTLVLPAMTRADADEALGQLVDAWLAGLRLPLPLACRTGFAALAEDMAGPAARMAYDGGMQRQGEGERPALARAYPDFAALDSARTDDGRGLLDWAQALYGPLWRRVPAARRGATNEAES